MLYRLAALYDASLERLYADARADAIRTLDLRPGQRVLEVPCGTGTSLPGLSAGVGPDGQVVGVDFSAAMVARARPAPNTTLVVGDVHTVPLAEFDRILVFLGLSVFPRWEEAFARLWEHLAPGGRMVVVDVYAERLSLQGRLVNLVASAEIRRRTWEPLERAASGFERRELPFRREHGGTLYLATGTKTAR